VESRDIPRLNTQIWCTRRKDKREKQKRMERQREPTLFGKTMIHLLTVLQRRMKKQICV